MHQPGPSPHVGGETDLSVAEARAAIAAVLRPITDTETVPLNLALGRILGADIVSPIDVPGHDNSAMDGYAFDGQTLKATGSTRLRIVGTALAGAPFEGRVAAFEALRIMTGAVMPAGLDTVVPQELVQADGEHVQVAAGSVQAGENRRRRGEDLGAGRPALRTGHLLKPADLGLVASLGIGSVRVLRRLRVAMFSTGNELRAPGQPLAPGSVYDSNRYSMLGSLQRLGFDVIDLGIVRDEPAALEATLRRAMEQADAVLTSGGVSTGDADHTRDLLGLMGEFTFWNVAMRPGRPFAFGSLRRSQGSPTWLFALPGNPVAALVTFHVLARDALLALAGAQPQAQPVLQVRAAAAIRKRPGRAEFQRAVVEPAADGSWQVRLTGSQGSGILRSMSEANALVVLREDQGSVAAGELVDVWLFDGLV